MDVRSPFFQNIALILAGVMFLNPIVASAAQLTVDTQAGGNTTIGQAQNGVPVVNIATPNGSGLSHNKFTDYNVGQQGLILNNGAQAFVPTQLGGYITGNPNLKNGAAGVILNEVTGSNRSQLKGYTEVAGQAAHVIVANPHGITCDGCGFINTPRATLTTGAPVVDNGRLQRFDVNGGDIAIEGAGLNAGNVDQFDLITRSAQINAEIHAKRLNVIAGRNEVDVATLHATAKADDGSSQPQLAIDSSALGGMYAGAIRLVGTEAGVGVKLAGDMAASAGDIQIDANGQLTTNRMAASNDVTLVAKGVELNADTYAGRNATVTSPGTVQVKESLAAGQRVAVQAAQLDNAGIIEAGVRADGSVSSAGHLQLDGGAVRNAGKLTSHGSLNTDLQKLDNQSGAITAAGNTTLKAEQLDNRNGEIVAQGSLTLDNQTLNNQSGSAVAGQALAIKAESTDNSAGTLAAGGAIEARVTGALSNDGGLVEAGSRLDIEADSLSNSSGRLRALGSTGESRFAIGTQLNNNDGLLEVGNSALSVEADALSNLGGVVRHLGTGGLNINMKLLGDAGGEFITNSAVTLSAEEWVNTSLLRATAITLDIARLTQTAAGGLLAGNSLVTDGESWINDGRIETNGHFDLQLSGDYRGKGSLLAVGNLDLRADNIEFDTGAQVRSGGYGNLAALGDLVSRGKLTASSWLALAAKSLETRGTTGTAGQLLIVADKVHNEDGLMFSGGNLELRTDQLTNRFATINSQGTLTLVGASSSSAKVLENISAEIESAQNMRLNVEKLINRRDAFTVSERLLSGSIRYHCIDCKGRHYDLYYYISENFERVVTSDSAASVITAGANFSHIGKSFDNQQSVVSAAGDIDISVESFTNQGASQERVVRDRTFRNPGDSESSSVFFGLVGNSGAVAQYAKYNSQYIHNYIERDDDGRGIRSPVSTGRQVTNRLNPNFNPSVGYGVPSRILGYSLVSSTEQSVNIGTAADAIVQAGGKVLINATDRLENGVTRENVSYVDGQQQAVDIAVSGNANPPVLLNAQLPPDLAQKAVDPLGLPSFSLPAGQNGLFSVNTNTQHPYLIETNPDFADLGRFLSSDYMIGRLGVTADQMQRRLGDGLYEQKLVRDAIIARTGQRFLAGITSDEQQFRYLMDNAIASKDALNLSLGVALSAEQVAALTHDIVWMEEREVAGQKVLAPVLYMAQANGRLAPTGALIQGQDVALITGGQLSNQGTLRALELTAQAGNVTNTGLMEANDKLRLMATESIRNARGGIIAGRDVSVTAVTGDVVNERTLTTNTGRLGSKRWQQDHVDNAARFEATGNLELTAGRDIVNRAGALSSGADMSLVAGRDVELGAVQTLQSSTRGNHYRNDRITQYGSDVNAGGNLVVTAGKDLSVVASRVRSAGDLDMKAGEDLLISSAANESHFLSRSKKVTQSRDQITQQSSDIQAGRNLSLDAGNDLTVVASNLRAQNDVDIDAGNDVQVLSAKDESASYYFKKKKGSFGRSSSQQKESYNSTNIASVIDAGNDLTINTSKATDGALNLDGGRDVTVIGSQLTAGSDLLVGGTGDVAVLSGVEEHGSYSKKTKSGFLGLSKSGKSQLKTSATQVASELEAGNDVVIAAGNDIRLRASTIEAGNDVELRSGLIKDTGDINLVSANDTAYSLTEQYRKKTGLSVSGGMLSVSSAKKAGQEARSSTSVGSHIAAERDASLLAERDINVIGSSVNAGRNLLLDAGRDVNVAAAQNQQGSTAWERERRTGIGLDSDRNGFTAFVGNDVQIEKGLNTRQTAAASSLEAGNDLDVKAGRDANLSGSDFSAGRDINVLAERDINLDAATERYFQEQQELHQRNGLTVNVSHNFGNTVDAIKGIGQGENLVSQVSGVLKAADAVTQFVSGPTTANHLGTTRQQTTTTDGVLSNRPTTMDAGRDVNLQAGNDINAKGSQIQAERDINMSGRDITLDVARGQQTSGTKQVISQNGINSGTTFNSARTGVGGSHGVHREEGTQGTALAAQLQAGRDIHLDASRDLELIGTRAEAGRDISLVAGNDIDIRAAQNDSEHEMRRKSGGGEVGLALGGQDFISVYASVDIGKGRLDREAGKQQEAYLYAGKQLSFESGRDTTVAGARLEGQDVVGKVGRDLLVSSVPDTGKVSGKELDASLTVSVGMYGSVSVSGSVGVGKTSGSTNWVENQTGIVARDRLDIRTENHTQLDGALLASDSGNLKLDTGTLGFRDIEGHDREHAWYINAGGTYSWGGDGGSGGQPADGNAAATGAVVDPSQQNKDGSNNWNLSGYDYRKEREQIVRATVGEGEIVVRSDTDTGRDSTAGLNRDVSKAYEVTKDKEERTDLYVSKSSLEAVSDPVVTLEQWKKSVEAYGENSEKALNELSKLFVAVTSIAEGDSLFEVEHKLIKHEIVKSLGDRNLEKRQEAARNLVDRVPGQATEAQRQAIVDYVANMAVSDPEGAFLFLSKLNFAAHGNPLQSHFAQAGTAALLVVGAVLLVAATNPESMDNMAQLGNTIMESVGQAGVAASEQIKVSAEIWWILVGSGTVFPIHQLDPKYGPLVNPVVDVNGQNPASGGYAEGGRIITTPHTGGSQLDGQQGGTSYTNPEHQLNPGNMYSERVELKGLAQNRPLQDLTHQELVKVFDESGFVLSNHAIKRLKDSRTKSIGFNTPNDIAKIFNDGVRFDAGNGEVGYSYRGLEAIVDPVTKRVVTFRPEKNRGG